MQQNDRVKAEKAILVGLSADCFRPEENATDESLDELEAVVLRILGTLPSVGCHPASDVQARASESAAVFTAVPDGAAGWLRSGGQTIRLTPNARWMCISATCAANWLTCPAPDRC